jgi:uncharacterized membrane protein YidH (DUF202 family)
MSDDQPKAGKKLSWWHMLVSVCSALIGVQSDKNLNSDFTSGRLWPFILLGLMVVIVFIMVLVLVVKVVVG